MVKRLFSYPMAIRQVEFVALNCVPYRVNLKTTTCLMCTLIKTRVDVEKVINFLERNIEQEKVLLKTHKVLNNEARYLEVDYEITQVERLLSFLRKCA